MSVSVKCPKCRGLAFVNPEVIEGEEVFNLHCTACGFLKDIKQLIEPKPPAPVRIPAANTIFYSMLLFIYHRKEVTTDDMRLHIDKPRWQASSKLGRLRDDGLVEQKPIPGVVSRRGAASAWRLTAGAVRGIKDRLIN